MWVLNRVQKFNQTSPGYSRKQKYAVNATNDSEEAKMYKHVTSSAQFNKLIYIVLKSGGSTMASWTTTSDAGKRPIELFIYK